MKTSIDKNNDFYAQIKRVEMYLQEYSASRYMCAIDTGIAIQNVCRYVSMLFERQKIAVVRKDKCLITGELVEYLTTDPAKFPKDTQLKLWV